MNAEKKYILVIVEGTSDRTTFENALRKLLQDFESNRSLEIDVVHGDLLTLDNNNKLIDNSQEENNVSKQVKKKINQLHLNAKDIVAIAMITDLDACFAPDSFFKDNPSINKAYYNLEENICERKNIDNLIAIRRKKLDVISHLYKKTHINIAGRMIKYRLFYLNVDLEWVFHSKLNQNMFEKTILSENFDDTYGNCTAKFLSFLNSLPMKGDNFLDSWNAVFNGELKPLERSTNIILLPKWIIGI